MREDDSAGHALDLYVRLRVERIVAWFRRVVLRQPDPDALATLRPEYQPDQHKTYVAHLNAAVRTPGVCNIALTGRYGAGKSSVLAEFADENNGRVLFLSLSTLGPDQVEDSRTNQIQKELVKQLLHRERPWRLPQSRYQRIVRLPRFRALLESAAGAGTIALILWLFDVFPKVPGLHGEEPRLVRAGAGVIAVIAVVSVVAWIRVSVHNKLELSEVTAAGASISLAKKSTTYFDQYLDEIVYFFEAMRKIDIVIFEDLDRFDEPGIFETLRELNTLLNNSKQSSASRFWRRRRRTIRFVYALRDSIFEKLGHDTKVLAIDDAATAESARANRTKFFDVVIPIVPFITHRTSRELLDRLLKDPTAAPVPAVSDELVDLVARHTPDMRQLINIRNEYAVFARRLITDKRGMETLTADELFAMVAYKNVHLSDFEHLLLGRSKLDLVYRTSRDIVTTNLAAKRARLTRIQSDAMLRDAVTAKAQEWGESLVWFFTTAASASGAAVSQYRIGEEETDDPPTSEAFWTKVLETNGSVSARVHIQRYNLNSRISLDMAQLRKIVGDTLRTGSLIDGPRALLKREETMLAADLDLLRTADFEFLASRPDLKVRLSDDAKESFSFIEVLQENIDSELARAMITQGFINRYYTLHVAQYYGKRVPPNAMNFIVQNVDRNIADFEYLLTDTDIKGLLAETKGAFLGDVSAYNVSLLDYLLSRDHAGADKILDRICRQIGPTEQAFLNTYLTAGQEARRAVAHMTGRLRSAFIQLIESADLSESRRIELVNTAISNADARVGYTFDEGVQEHLQANYRYFHTLAEQEDLSAHSAGATALDPPSEQEIRNAVETLKAAGVVVDDLTPLRPAAVAAIVERHCYEITASNLRTALGDPQTLSLDTIYDLDQTVYNQVLAVPAAYVTAVNSDFPPSPAVRLSEDGDHGSAADEAGLESDVIRTGSGGAHPQTTRTTHTIDDPARFFTIVSTLGDVNLESQIALLTLAADGCTIENLEDSKPLTWDALAACGQFPTTVANVWAYIGHVGEVNEPLAAMLTASGEISPPAPEPRPDADGNEPPADFIEKATLQVVEKVLRASEQLPAAETRVDLVASLESVRAIDLSWVPNNSGRLLGHLVRTGVCKDEEATFRHFDLTDWPTISFAIEQSSEFFNFATPDLLGPEITAKLLKDPGISKETKTQILDRFDTFVPAESPEVLRLAGEEAMKIGHLLTASQITRIVQGDRDGAFAVGLVQHFRKNLTAAEAREAVAQASGDYGLLTTAGSSLAFPIDLAHRAFFKRLQDDGLVTHEVHTKKLLGTPRIDVIVQ